MSKLHPEIQRCMNALRLEVDDSIVDDIEKRLAEFQPYDTEWRALVEKLVDAIQRTIDSSADDGVPDIYHIAAAKQEAQAKLRGGKK